MRAACFGYFDDSGVCELGKKQVVWRVVDPTAKGNKGDNGLEVIYFGDKVLAI